ncbi:MAG TPA: DoxX family protein [Candidatus Dormibacteraeota bacterium]|nr:DoxX family protein [Candidatus Dormibacteraeota bacterium]
MDRRLNSSWWALRIALGVAPFLAGLDKFFNLLTKWTTYLNPLVLRVVPVGPETFMHAVGVVEMLVGVAILTRWTRWGAYVAAAWLVGIALSLITMGAFFDVAVRDLLIAVAAFSLARLTEVREASVANSFTDRQELERPSAA